MKTSGRGRDWRKGLGKPILTAEEILVKGQRGKRHRPHRNHLERALRDHGRLLSCEGLKEFNLQCPVGPEWNGRTLQLQIDHFDGDPLNNEESNLRFLCPNCHSQTATYGNKRRI